jgi:hypothetical protein
VGEAASGSRVGQTYLVSCEALARLDSPMSYLILDQVAGVRDKWPDRGLLYIRVMERIA